MGIPSYGNFRLTNDSDCGKSPYPWFKGAGRSAASFRSVLRPGKYHSKWKITFGNHLASESS